MTKIAVLSSSSLEEIAEAFPDWLKRFVKHERSFMVAIKAISTWKENIRLKKEGKMEEEEKNENEEIKERRKMLKTRKSFKIINTLRELESRPAGEIKGLGIMKEEGTEEDRESNPGSPKTPHSRLRPSARDKAQTISELAAPAGLGFELNQMGDFLKTPPLTPNYHKETSDPKHLIHLRKGRVLKQSASNDDVPLRAGLKPTLSRENTASKSQVSSDIHQLKSQRSKDGMVLKSQRSKDNNVLKSQRSKDNNVLKSQRSKENNILRSQRSKDRVSAMNSMDHIPEDTRRGERRLPTFMNANEDFELDGKSRQSFMRHLRKATATGGVGLKGELY